MVSTTGLNHLGLTVLDLDKTTTFFVDVLGWTQTAYDPAYPRTTVTDGAARLTLWQARRSEPITSFDRHANVGLHHVAFSVASKAELDRLAQVVCDYAGAEVEFMPEPMGDGPRQHMIFADPSGLRIELVWAGET